MAWLFAGQVADGDKIIGSAVFGLKLKNKLTTLLAEHKIHPPDSAA